MEEAKFLVRDLRSTHFQLGSQKGGNRSTYSCSYAPVAGKQGKAAQISTWKDSHFVLGTDKDKAKSTYAINYKEKQGESVTLNRSVMADLRACHYELGYDKAEEKSSLYDASFVLSKEKSQPHVSRQQRLKEMQQDYTFPVVNKMYNCGDDASNNIKSKGLSKSFLCPRYIKAYTSIAHENAIIELEEII